MVGSARFRMKEKPKNIYFEDAASKGDIWSRYRLAELSAREGKNDLAVKHYHLAAAAGSENATKCLWCCFNQNVLSKTDLEKALRAHKAASDEMNSEERKRFAAYEEAIAGNDRLLKLIYTGYYNAFINAKELKKALKAHQAGNRRGVEALLNEAEARAKR